MPPTATSVISSLERFATLFSKGNCYLEGDLLRCVYSNSFLAAKGCCEANILIDSLRLDLVAMRSFGETIIVKSSEVDAI